MINSASTKRRTLALLLFVLALGTCILHAKTDDKLAPADLVAKHLDSIGSPEARARVHGTKIKGNCTITVKLCGEGQVDGQVLMGSQGPANLINMNFDTPAYPYEALRFDGKKFAVSQFKPGSRTCLAQFFLSNDVIFKEGLVGGTLSESWPLLHLEEKNPKLEYAGLKKVGNTELHALKYNPRKGSDVKIVLFFDPATFRHVRTEYTRIIYASEQRRIAGGGGGLPPATNQQATSARIEAVEEFSDFRPESGLNVPHVYKFHLSVQSELRPALIDWIFNLTDYSFNSPLDATEFTIANEAKKEKSN